ncbi:uncharacterized protein LOC143282819 [Babylonia areolata]|uniref:uncharacterized protein LOC143282819 n=1 Tax=Babylonia areolata TaxID=304850 RepID=UPI003FD426CE
MAPPYSRAPLPAEAGDQVLAASLLPAMYPQLPHLPTSHPGIPVAGHGAVTNLAMAGYQHHHSTDPSVVTNRLTMGGDGLPDIVHSHNVGHALPPRPNHHRSGTTAAGAVSRQQRQRQQQSSSGGHGRRRSGGRDSSGHSAQQRRRSRTQSSSSAQADSGRCKEPCVKCMVAVTSIRWVIVVLSILGVLFLVAGVIMAALHAVGNNFLIYALVFIGLGVLLFAVVFVTWKTTPPGAEPIHALFNIGNNSQSSRRERRPRRTRRTRDGQWHGGVLYPEFQYRRPPPSYAASMQAYHAQMMDTQSNNNTITLVSNNNSQDTYSLPGSPPPSYRSRASTIHSGVHITFPPGHDSAPNSRPPTYRSRANSHPRPRLSMDDSEPWPSSSAQADVSFAGPMLTADDVQQIIGTNRRRQQTSRTDVGHVRSASLDLAQGSELVQHQRGSSLDLGMASGTQSVSTQDNHMEMHVRSGRENVLRSERDSASPPDNATQQSVSDTSSSEPQNQSVKKSSVDRAQVVESASECGAVGGDVDDADVGVVVDNDDSRASGDTDREPEQYNTAL